MFKPNIVAPGTSLTSAGMQLCSNYSKFLGVRLDNQTDSCNIKISSGTSMATPMVSGAAIIIRQYFENSTYWANVCNNGYRSCPTVSKLKSGFISGALLKAAIVKILVYLLIFRSIVGNQ